MIISFTARAVLCAVNRSIIYDGNLLPEQTPTASATNHNKSMRVACAAREQPNYLQDQALKHVLWS